MMIHVESMWERQQQIQEAIVFLLPVTQLHSYHVYLSVSKNIKRIKSIVVTVVPIPSFMWFCMYLHVKFLLVQQHLACPVPIHLNSFLCTNSPRMHIKDNQQLNQVSISSFKIVKTQSSLDKLYKEKLDFFLHASTCFIWQHRVVV